MASRTPARSRRRAARSSRRSRCRARSCGSTLYRARRSGKYRNTCSRHGVTIADPSDGIYVLTADNPSRHMRRLGWTLVLPLAITAPSTARSQGSLGATFSFEEVMIPVRDGARLQTVIMRPAGHSEPLPILLRRHPYGVPNGPPPAVALSQSEFWTDGYIIVIQNLRGRFKSEGTFLLSSAVNL